MPLILKNASFIHYRTLELKNTHILVEEGIDSSIRFFDNPKEIEDYDNIPKIDCSGKLVTKSFAVGHHHVYSALARGIPAPVPAPKNFFEKLQYLWWRLDKSLNRDSIEASALATAIACAKAGATFVVDHHASPNFIEGSLDIIADVFNKAGINHLLCYEITDRDGPEKAEMGLAETERYLLKNQGLVGLHASFTVGDKTMQQATDLMNKMKSGIHIHVAEDGHDQDECLKKYNKRVIDRFIDYGFIESPKSILVHCLHLSPGERETIQNSQAWIAQNMESNLNNKVGFFNSERLGNRIFLGTDGMHSDMIRSAQWAHFAGQQVDKINFGDTYFRLRNVHKYLKSNNFKGDGENNLIVLDYPGPTPLSKDNFLGHFLFGFNSSHIQHVISNGKLIVKDRKIQTLVEEEVLKYTRQQAERLWGKFKEQGA